MNHTRIKLLQHAMKIVERVLERRMQKLISLNEIQFGFMPGKRTIDAVATSAISTTNY